MPDRDVLHLTCIVINGRGVLIEGASGAGKSDLALRLIDRGAELVSDDYVELSAAGGRLLARAPARIAGRMEVRGIGIVPMPHRGETCPVLLVALREERDRMPEPTTRSFFGVEVPSITIDPRFASAPIKVEVALRTFAGPAA